MTLVNPIGGGGVYVPTAATASETSPRVLRLSCGCELDFDPCRLVWRVQPFLSVWRRCLRGLQVQTAEV